MVFVINQKMVFSINQINSRKIITFLSILIYYVSGESNINFFFLSLIFYFSSSIICDYHELNIV